MIFAILAYALAMTCANLTVAAFGPWVSPINAFFLIGLDLTLRDHLHVRLKPWQMLGLIAATGLLTLALNPAAGKIAVASAVAFTAAALVDWAAFSGLRYRPWMLRVNGSNAAGALVDSLVFPTLAFGAFMPHIVALQFAAKVAGGAAWAFMLARMLPSADAAAQDVPQAREQDQQTAQAAGSTQRGAMTGDCGVNVGGNRP